MNVFWKKLRENTIFLVLAGILCIYFAAICLINFSGRPGFYNTDMYADMVFAAKVWNQKSLIPDGWVFGNQLYVVATPALAALYNGVASDPQIAMAMASVTMTILILLSFWWMLKPVFPSADDRLFCIVLFMTLGLYFGDSVGTENGWQLFFTMCAYYACYLINVLLAFGCCLRADGKKGKSFWLLLGLTCILSFCTGIQSLRQTAVMSLPLMAMAFLRFLQDIRRKQNWKRSSLAVSCGICLSNVLGLLYGKTIDFTQTQIFGELGLVPPGEILDSFVTCLKTIRDLMRAETLEAVIVRWVLLLSCVILAFDLYFRKKEEERSGSMLLTGLLILSVLVIAGIDLLTTMEIRRNYYFMLYVLIAFLAAFGFSRQRILLRKILLGITVLGLVLPSMIALKDICMQAYFARYDRIYEVSDYLQEKGYTTVYAPWNLGEDIAIASDFEIQAGFWDEEMLVPVVYLCDPVVYAAKPDACVYTLFGAEGAQQAEKTAESRNVELHLEAYLPESNVYIYTAPVNLMQRNDQ